MATVGFEYPLYNNLHQVPHREQWIDYWARYIYNQVNMHANLGYKSYSNTVLCGFRTTKEYLGNDIVIDVKRVLEKWMPLCKITYKCISVTPCMNTVLEVRWG